MQEPCVDSEGKYKPQQHHDTHTETDLLANQEGNELEIYVPILISTTPPSRKGNLHPASHSPAKLALKAENHFEGHQIDCECRSSHEQKEKHSS